ncbi:MAG: DUF4116 domain-containing protein [Alphaproteobacteria bacterium]|nr:DUF4116 domain-containing protein [Alphaproteobacteria bacterium]
MLTLIHADEAAARCKLKERMSCFSSWQWDAEIKNSAVLLCEGDLIVPGDLVLDHGTWPNGLLRLLQVSTASFDADLRKRAISGLVVTGNLELRGALINADMESGAFLLVRGGLRARNVSGGGAEIRIDGPAVVTDAVIGHYNDGILSFNDSLDTPLCISRDHDLAIHGPRRVGYDWNGHDGADHNELTAMHRELGGDYDALIDVLPLSLAQRVRADVDRWSTLEEALAAGGPVLHEPGGAPTRTEPASKERIGAQWDRLRLIPEDERTPELCDAALSSCGWALVLVPRALWTDERLFKAVELSPSLLHEVIPPERVTPAMIAMAARKATFDGLPARFRTQDVLIALLREQAGDRELKVLAETPNWYITKKVLAAVRESYASHPRYKELEAARANIKGTETFFLTRDIWAAFLSEDQIIASVKESGYANQIHPSNMTPAVCDAMVKRNGHNLGLLPPERITDQHIDMALGYSGANLAYVPEERRTPARCQVAVADDGHALQHVPAQLRSADLCAIAVAKQGLALEFVPDALRTRDLCLSALDEDGRALEHVPPALRDEEMCRKAFLHQYAASIELVPAPYHAALTQEKAAFDDARRQQDSAEIAATFDRLSKFKVPSASGLVLGAMFSPSKSMAATGPFGWLIARPLLLLIAHLAASVAFLGVHAWLVVHAATNEGWLAAILTLLVVILAEIYWCVKFAMEGQFAAASLTAIVTMIYLMTLAVRRMAARVYAATKGDA